MAINLPTGELARHLGHLEMATTPSAIERSKHWASQHLALVIVLAAIAFVLWTLAAVEFGHWMAEGFPPLLPHLGEAFKHMAGLVGKWMWIPLKWK